MLIDFHTHLDFYKREKLQKQLSNFSGTIIAASVDEKSFLENCGIAEWAKKSVRACRIIPTFGIHPNRADENAGLLLCCVSCQEK